MKSTYTNKRLTDLARDQACQRCGKQDGTTVSSHSNQYKHGKGMGLTAHDCFIAWLCGECHTALDQGPDLTKQERRDMWQAAHERTLLQMWVQGLIKVK